jgi:hypothetical protein
MVVILHPHIEVRRGLRDGGSGFMLGEGVEIPKFPFNRERGKGELEIKSLRTHLVIVDCTQGIHGRQARAHRVRRLLDNELYYPKGACMYCMTPPLHPPTYTQGRSFAAFLRKVPRKCQLSLVKENGNVARDVLRTPWVAVLWLFCSRDTWQPPPAPAHTLGQRQPWPRVWRGAREWTARVTCHRKEFSLYEKCI